MTEARDALADVIHQMRQADPDGCLHEDGYGGTGWVQCERDTYSLLDALDALGFTVARTQDARDGEALRLLREAMGPGRAIRLSGPWGGQFWDVSVESRATVATHAEASRVGLSQALEACRAAIEATR